MNHVTLQDDGRLLHDDRAIQANPLGYLGLEVKLAPACTLRSFFRCMARYPDLAAINPFLDSFLECYDQCDKDGCRCDGIDYLAQLHNILIVFDVGPLDAAGVDIDAPITLKAQGIKLHTALTMMLTPLDMTIAVEDGALLLTTKEKDATGGD